MQVSLGVGVGASQIAAKLEHDVFDRANGRLQDFFQLNLPLLRGRYDRCHRGP